MIRLLMIAAGTLAVIAAATAIKYDPGLLSQALHLLDHKARGAGAGINARLGTWITPKQGGTP